MLSSLKRALAGVGFCTDWKRVAVLHYGRMVDQNTVAHRIIRPAIERIPGRVLVVLHPGTSFVGAAGVALRHEATAYPRLGLTVLRVAFGHNDRLIHLRAALASLKPKDVGGEPEMEAIPFSTEGILEDA